MWPKLGFEQLVLYVNTSTL